MDSFNSILDTIKERATNPFFGTLIGVWIFRNWMLIYTIFNFDEETKLNEKQKFIENYFSKQNFISELFINIGISICLVILAFMLIVFTRVIINISNHLLTPYFNSKTVSKLVVNNNRFQTVKSQRDNFFTSLQEAQETIINLEQKNSLLRTENAEFESLKVEKNRLESNIEELDNQNKILHQDLINTNKDLLLKDNEISIQKNKFQKLNWEKNLLEDIFIADYLQFESLSNIGKKELLKKIPIQLFEPFDLLQTNISLLNTFETILKAKKHPSNKPLNLDIDLVKQLQSIGLITSSNKNLGLEIENIEITPIANLIQKLKEPLQEKWNDENLPF